MILVTGATGTTGRELVQRLRAKGQPIRALVRDVEKAATLLGPDIELFEGDLDAPGTLPGALENVDKVFLLAAVDPRMAEMCSNLIVAAKDAGIGQVVRFSGMGANVNASSEILRMHAQADNLLRDSGVPFTILQPSAFMQNMLWTYRSEKERGAICIPLRDARLSLVDVRDLADFASTVLTSPGHEGMTYVLTGPESLGVSEMAKTISEVTGKPVEYVDVSPAAAERAMLEAGLSPWRATAVTEIYIEFSTGAYGQVTDTMANVFGKPPRTFVEFVRDHAASF